MYRARAPTRPLSVLVVDDYPDSAAGLAFLLTLEGFAARAAVSAGEALTSAAADPPDVVVIEPRMPGGGWELARRLGAKVAGKRPLMLALTTDASPAGRSAAAAAGIDLYLVKPEHPAVLIGVLRRFERATGRALAAADRYTNSPRRRAGIPAIRPECPGAEHVVGV